MKAALKVALFVTCLVDLLRPRIGFSSLRLLEDAGCTVVVPSAQTCCGQPAFSAGDRRSAQAVARKTIAELEACADCACVVVPSASCAAQIRNEYPALFADDPAWRTRAEALAARTWELSVFLADVLKVAGVAGRFAGSVAVHDSCSGLRGLAIKTQPRRLLATLAELELREMPDAEACCGFGGSFALRFGELSTAIVERKCASIEASGADAVVGCDLGCLLNIEGRLRRNGDLRTRVLHIAEVLAGEAAVGEG